MNPGTSISRWCVASQRPAAATRGCRLHADGHKRQDPVGGGGAVAAEALAIVTGFVGVEFGGGEEKPAIGVIGALRVEILAALDEDARATRSAGSDAGTPAARKASMTYRVIERSTWPVSRRSAAFATHSPGAVGRIGRMPAVLLGELLRAQIGDHRLYLLPSGLRACARQIALTASAVE